MSLTLPASIANVEPVRSIRTPARLDYTFTAGNVQTEFLRAVEQGKLIGRRCHLCNKVYLPPRGSCATDGVPLLGGEVELADTGTVTTYCVVNVQFYGQAVEVPYICATVLVDGSDLGLFGMVGEMPASEVRMGLRVKAVWDDDPRPSLERIKWWAPTGEPDADYETFRKHLG
jgi:uncharacterized OB-fold protein